MLPHERKDLYGVLYLASHLNSPVARGSGLRAKDHVKPCGSSIDANPQKPFSEIRRLPNWFDIGMDSQLDRIQTQKY